MKVDTIHVFFILKKRGDIILPPSTCAKSLFLLSIITKIESSTYFQGPGTGLQHLPITTVYYRPGTYFDADQK